MISTDKCVDNMKKEALRAAKEIAVKFIETGRISPVNFADVFPNIYTVIFNSLSQEPQIIIPKLDVEEK